LLWCFGLKHILVDDSSANVQPSKLFFECVLISDYQVVRRANGPLNGLIEDSAVPLKGSTGVLLDDLLYVLVLVPSRISSRRCILHDRLVIISGISARVSPLVVDRLWTRTPGRWFWLHRALLVLFRFWVSNESPSSGGRPDLGLSPSAVPVGVENACCREQRSDVEGLDTVVAVPLSVGYFCKSWPETAKMADLYVAVITDQHQIWIIFSLACIAPILG
jgi:hypothetical protein